jgi:hypothetical protein
VEAGLSVLEIVQVHHDVVAGVAAGRPQEDVAPTIGAAGDFLIESLAAFEMVQRGFSDAQRAAFVERRNARMLRQLSALLADESLATGDAEALQEVLQLVAENAREITAARSCSIRVTVPGVEGALEARTDDDGDDTWSEVLQPGDRPAESAHEGAAIQAPLLSLEGTSIGYVEVVADSFTSADEAALTQVAQMTAAALERSFAYR